MVFELKLACMVFLTEIKPPSTFEVSHTTHNSTLRRKLEMQIYRIQQLSMDSKVTRNPSKQLSQRQLTFSFFSLMVRRAFLYTVVTPVAW
jgi:hypothetical protein